MKSTIGIAERASITTNAAKPTAAVTSSATISTEPQPQALPSISASTSDVRATDQRCDARQVDAAIHGVVA